MHRTLAGLSIVVVGLLSAACGGSAPAGASGAAATPPAASVAGNPDGLPENELTVEQLCAALTAEELATILGEDVTIDPAETVWCGYDLEDGSGMFLVGNDDTAEGFVEQALAFDCEAKPVEGGAVLSSCGSDLEEGRPTEAWFLLDGVGVQLSVDTEATEAQYLEMIREALDADPPSVPPRAADAGWHDVGSPASSTAARVRRHPPTWRTVETIALRNPSDTRCARRGKGSAMPFKRALLAAVSMAALSVSAVAADHGGIANPPPDGVVFAEPSDWSQNPESGAVRPGPNCRQFAPTGDSTVSFAHGARLGRDYERVIVQGHAAPLSATVYDEPKAGEWVWHDENANGRFDPGDDGTYAIYVCGERTSSGLPPTDAAPPSQPHSALFMLLAAAGAAGLLLMRRHPRIE